MGEGRISAAQSVENRLLAGILEPGVEDSSTRSSAGSLMATDCQRDQLKEEREKNKQLSLPMESDAEFARTLERMRDND